MLWVIDEFCLRKMYYDLWQYESGMDRTFLDASKPPWPILGPAKWRRLLAAILVVTKILNIISFPIALRWNCNRLSSYISNYGVLQSLQVLYLEIDFGDLTLVSVSYCINHTGGHGSSLNKGISFNNKTMDGSWLLTCCIKKIISMNFIKKSYFL